MVAILLLMLWSLLKYLSRCLCCKSIHIDIHQIFGFVHLGHILKHFYLWEKRYHGIFFRNPWTNTYVMNVSGMCGVPHVRNSRLQKGKGLCFVREITENKVLILVYGQGWFQRLIWSFQANSSPSDYIAMEIFVRPDAYRTAMISHMNVQHTNLNPS